MRGPENPRPHRRPDADMSSGGLWGALMSHDHWIASEFGVLQCFPMGDPWGRGGLDLGTKAMWDFAATSPGLVARDPILWMSGRMRRRWP